LIKLGSRNHVGPRRIPIELLCPNYDEGSRQAGRPSSAQSLATLPTWLRIATTLRMRALQVEFSKCGVCVMISTGGGVVIGSWGSSTDLAEAVAHQVTAGRPSHMAGRPGGMASTALVVPLSCRHMSTKPWAEPT
jgi:hypothetical protein